MLRILNRYYENDIELLQDNLVFGIIFISSQSNTGVIQNKHLLMCWLFSKCMPARSVELIQSGKRLGSAYLS